MANLLVFRYSERLKPWISNLLVDIDILSTCPHLLSPIYYYDVNPSQMLFSMIFPIILPATFLFLTFFSNFMSFGLMGSVSGVTTAPAQDGGAR